MKKRILAWICACTLLALGLAGCGAKSTNGENEEPKSAVKGYYDVDQIYRGGADSQSVNIKKVTVEEGAEETKIELQFVSGTETASGGESALDAPPTYTLRVLPKPYRVELQLKGVGYWDYNVVKGLTENGLVAGSLRQIPVDTENTVLYFQLNDRPVYKVTEDKGTLTLYLKGTKEKNDVSYHISVNAFFDFQEGKVPVDIGLAPSLCSDLENATLVSDPYDTKKKAEEELEQIQTWFDQNLPGKTAQVVELSGNQLPDYDNSADLAELENRPVSRNKDGLGVNYPVALSDGRVLALSQEGRMFVAKPLQLDNDAVNEELYVSNDQGKLEKCLNFEFSTIGRAQFSPGGKRVAFVEQTSQYNLLYAVDLTDNSLDMISEMGVGNDVASFAWADDDVLYCMSQTDQWQLMKVDLTKEGEDAISVASKQEGSSGNVACLGNDVFFMGYDSEGSDVIFRMNQKGKVKQYAKGTDYQISPDGKWMLISELGNEEEVMETKLVLRDLATNEDREIVAPAQIRNMAWSASSQIIYYDLNRWENETSFPFELHTYSLIDGTDQKQMDLIPYNSLIPTELDGERLLEANYTKNDQVMPVVYRLTIK